MGLARSARSMVQNYPFDYMLLIFLSYAIPAAYGLLNRYFIGFMSYESVVVDQTYEGVEVLLEVLLEMFPIAVLALIAKNFLNKKTVSEILGTALLMQLIVTVSFLLGLSLFVDYFIDWINTPESAKGLAKKFFLTSFFAIPFHSMNILIFIAIKSLRKGWLAVFLAFVGVIINFLLDAVLISNFPFSLQLGLIGSAWAKVISSTLLFVISVFTLKIILNKSKGYFFGFKKKIAQSIFKIGRWAGLESLVRNLGYIIGVISVVNFIEGSEVSVIGGYNTAMWVMWAIVLIPVLAWTEATNIAIGNAYGKNDFQTMKKIQKTSIYIVGTYMIIWMIIGSFVWNPISFWLNGNAKIEVIEYSVITFQFMIIPYLFFSIGSILKSFFIGIGQPFWIFFSSAIVNLGIYIPLGFMVKTGLIQVTFIEFLLISNIVFMIDFLIIFFALRKYGFKRKSNNELELSITN
jgi:Na+-driven multidrug efflux pump